MYLQTADFQQSCQRHSIGKDSFFCKQYWKNTRVIESEPLHVKLKKNLQID